MTPETIVAELEERGIRLEVDGDRLMLEAPADRVPSPEIMAGLREIRSAVVRYLLARSQPSRVQFSSSTSPIVWKNEKLENWPFESREAERRFGVEHAKLFPFIGRKVRTPQGPGTLIQVFSDRATVVLDSKLGICTVFKPVEVVPASWDL